VYHTAWQSPGAAVGMASALAFIVLVLVLLFRWPQLKLLARTLKHA
jgi:ABC-type sugar transport system permease subunit